MGATLSPDLDNELPTPRAARRDAPGGKVVVGRGAVVLALVIGGLLVVGRVVVGRVVVGRVVVGRVVVGRVVVGRVVVGRVVVGVPLLVGAKKVKPRAIVRLTPKSRRLTSTTPAAATFEGSRKLRAVGVLVTEDAAITVLPNQTCGARGNVPAMMTRQAVRT